MSDDAMKITLQIERIGTEPSPGDWLAVERDSETDTIVDAKIVYARNAIHALEEFRTEQARIKALRADR